MSADNWERRIRKWLGRLVFGYFMGNFAIMVFICLWEATNPTKTKEQRIVACLGACLLGAAGWFVVWVNEPRRWWNR